MGIDDPNFSCPLGGTTRTEQKFPLNIFLSVIGKLR